MKQTSLRLASAALLAGAGSLTVAGVANADTADHGPGGHVQEADSHEVDGSGPFPSLLEGVLGGVGGALHGVLGDDLIEHILTGIV